MRKRSKNLTIIAGLTLLIILVAVVLLKTNLLSFVTEETLYNDYAVFSSAGATCNGNVCENTDWYWYKHCQGAVTSSPETCVGGTVANGWNFDANFYSDRIRMYSTYIGGTPDADQDIVIKAKDDFYGKDVLIKISPDQTNVLGFSFLGVVHVMLDGTTVDIPVNADNVGEVYKIKFLSNISNASHIKVYLNDVFDQDVFLTNNNLKVTIKLMPNAQQGGGSGSPVVIPGGGLAAITALKVREPCGGDGYFQVDETFKGVQNVTVNNLLYDNALFCPQLQSYRLVNGVISVDESINQLLSQAQQVVVGQSQVIKVQYFIDNVGQIPVECLENNSGVFSYCKDVSGFVHVCSEGAFDINTGTCANTNSASFCLASADNSIEPVRIYGTFDTAQNKCYYYSPQGDACIYGAYDGNYKCVWKPNCGLNVTFNNVTDQCCSSQLPAFNPTSGLCEEFATNVTIPNQQGNTTNTTVGNVTSNVTASNTTTVLVNITGTTIVTANITSIGNTTIPKECIGKTVNDCLDMLDQLDIKKNLIYIGVFVGSLFVLGMIYFIYKNRRRR